MSVFRLVHSYWFIVIGFFALFIFLYPIPQTLNPTLAQTSTPSATPTTYSAQIATPSAYPLRTRSEASQPLGQVSPQSPQYANLMVNNLLHSFSCLMAGFSPIDQPCVDYLNGVPVVSSVNTSGGLLGATSNMLTMVIANPPIRTGQYLATLGDSLGLTKEAHAQVQGSGAGVLKPIENLWQVSRNIAYIAMIFIFVVIGLMIMFRTRINPQAVISIQAALPGLVIGLILITFSYFLASLLTDTAYLATNLVGYYFQAAQPPTTTPGAPSNLVDRISGESTLSISGRFLEVIKKEDTTGAVAALWDSLPPEVARILTATAAFLAFQYGSSLTNIGIPVVNVIGGLLTSIVTAGNPQAIIGLVLWIIAIAVLIYNMLKLLIRLINNYLTIIFLTITAPFHFLVASLPGRQEIAIDWIRNMLCNILAFPAVLAVFYFVAYIFGPGEGGNAVSRFFSITDPTSVTGPSTLPLLGGLDLNFIRVLLAYGALVATPAVPDIVCRIIGKVGAEGQLIGQEIAGESRTGIAYVQRGVSGVERGGGALGGLVDQPEYIFNPLTGRTETRWRMGAIRSAGLQLGGIGSWIRRRFR